MGRAQRGASVFLHGIDWCLTNVCAGLRSLRYHHSCLAFGKDGWKAEIIWECQLNLHYVASTT